MRLFVQRPAASGFAVVLGLATGCALALGPIAGSLPSAAAASETSSVSVVQPHEAPVTARSVSSRTWAAPHCDELQAYLDLGRPFIEGRRSFSAASRSELTRLADTTRHLGEEAPARLQRPWAAMTTYLDDKAAGRASLRDFVDLAETLSSYDGSIERDARASCGITWPS